MVDPVLVDVPTRVETPRLILRPLRAGDGLALHEALVESIVELRRALWFIPWIAEEQTPDSAELRCRKSEANFLARTDLPFLAFEKSAGRLVGSIGLHRTDWQVPKTEVGYWIRTSAARNGYATEGVRALVACAFDRLGAQRVELVADEQNMSSRRVAERCGFELEGILRNVQRGQDGRLRNACIYARLPAATQALAHSPPAASARRRADA
jgi:RimJ/RimL family protein N-acetyltransferase